MEVFISDILSGYNSQAFVRRQQSAKFYINMKKVAQNCKIKNRENNVFSRLCLVCFATVKFRVTYTWALVFRTSYFLLWT